jgi:hypothetical protein
MGQRGPGARPISRKPSANERPSARTRAKRAEVVFGSEPYGDLLLGDLDGRPRYWRNPHDPARRAAWLEHREALRRRWPFAWSHGARPDAWWAFEAPELAARKGLVGQLKDMTWEEIVYRLDAGAAERADIEELWERGSIDEPEWFKSRRRRG